MKLELIIFGITGFLLYNAYHDGKASCNVCGSEHLIHSGLYGNQSKSRYYVCLKCKSWLYKFKVI